MGLFRRDFLAVPASPAMTILERLVAVPASPAMTILERLVGF